MKKFLLMGGWLLAFQPISAGDEFCGIRNRAFEEGESISYNVFYSVIGLYVNAGTANFSVSLDRMNNRTAYHIVGK